MCQDANFGIDTQMKQMKRVFDILILNLKLNFEILIAIEF